MAAAVYGASEGLKTLLIEKRAPGGQAGTSSRIENYLGFPSGISGADLANRATTQARRLGAEVLTAQKVAGIRVEDPYRIVVLEDGTELMQEIPYLDLSDAPIQAYYEREVVTYPASYVSLLYPSAMMGDSVATGDVAPEWISPGSARGSRLIAKVNAESESTAGKFAWETAAHPEDVGEAPLTREERMLLIRMADLGGQYWSRRNVEGAADWNSATEYP